MNDDPTHRILYDEKSLLKLSDDKLFIDGLSGVRMERDECGVLNIFWFNTEEADSALNRELERQEQDRIFIEKQTLSCSLTNSSSSSLLCSRFVMNLNNL